MSFLRTSFWGAISTGTVMLCGLITTKYVAVMVGPKGMAYVGQFTNITMLVALLATGACGSGIIKYLSEHKDQESRKRIVANAFLIAGTCMLVCALLLIIFSKTLSQKIFNESSFWRIFVLYGILLIFPTFNGIANAIFNGLQRIREMSVIGIIASVLNLAAVLIAAKYFGIQGVLVAGLIASFFTFFIYAFALKKTMLVRYNEVLPLYDKDALRKLFGFSLMAIVSGIIAPSLQLYVRTNLLHNFDAGTAGLWQANTRLSDYYLNFVYTVLGIYYLPKLSEIKEPQFLKKEIWLGYKRIIPAVILITIVIWICREWIVQVFLTPQFRDMLVLLKWQLIGDVIKIASWILGCLMIAKAMTKPFIISELVFSTTFVLLNYLLIGQYGLLGTVYAFTLNYTIYLIWLLIFLRKKIF